MKNENENESHDESVQQIRYPFHKEHPLVLVAEQSNEGLKAHCHGCGELLSAPCFACIHCNYHLHKQCAEAPLEIPNHPLHPEHSDEGFFLRRRPELDDDWKCLDELPSKINHPSHPIHPFYNSCDLCQKGHSGAFYGCSLCHFKIDVGCAWPRSIVEDKSRHQHPFICDACGTQGNYISYTYLTRRCCNICFNEVKLDRGSYSCRKPGCNYIVHVKCVLEHRRLYEVIEEEKQCEELSMQSSIIRVIEVNEAGEAAKIAHLSHQHCLVLADKMEEEIDRKCDGCILPISNIFYYCSKCPFFFHKTCAELPRIKQHWFRQSNATLNFDKYLNMCIRCAKVADIIECEGHQHFLFFDFKCKEKCNGCGERCRNGAFRCGKCRFALDFGSLHKIDEHKLKLTYHDDKEQSYCDICEQYRDPSLWYYSCSICDTSAHIEYVLGQLPFLKDGVTFPPHYYDHHHALKFFRKVEGFPECSCCGKFCQEEILKCEKSTCNYIVHYKYECRWGD
ncbi:hypothetical protein GOBAR_DD28055 [Gossypium barbadense]|nr:hypothetical protein GOBAR_DD28055 [Gossypium barbadense]